MAFGTLYTHNPTPRGFAIQAIAKTNGLDLDIVYAEKENKENYEKLLEYNPLGQVPVFVGADGFVLTEAIAIALFVTTQNKETPLLGTSRLDHLQVLKWLSFANSELLPNLGGVILPLMHRPQVIRHNADDCLREFHNDCRVLEKHLSTDNKKYLVAEQLTLADLFTVGTLVYAVKVFHPVLKVEYPRLMEWFTRVYEEPMFKEVVGELELFDVPFPELPEHEK
ncbi:glutathione S-transferase [Podospora didyma]|uniref:Glutathione S-transferase n=1 Tax=Podospora didyma TaxID=330526 RepID=A0AAE0N432_9PEZI|nr:glutathione S-transferase [Podospora didyma]